MRRGPLAIDRWLPLLPLGLAAWFLWHGLVTLPHEYTALSTRGVPVRVHIDACGPGEGTTTRGMGCRVHTFRDGARHEWKVDQDVRSQARPDGTAGGLVDPKNPRVSALASDVDARSGAGPDGSNVALAVLMGALAAAFAIGGWWARARATVRRQRPE